MSQTANSLTSLALQKFKKNFWGVLSLCYIVLCGIIALFAYVFAPDNSQNANQMHLSIHSRGPGFTVSMLTIPSAVEGTSFNVSSLFFGKQNNDTEIPITSYTIENDAIIYTPYVGDDIEGISKRLQMEEGVDVYAFAKAHIASQKFLLGTDKYGRDLLSRMFVGARISFSIGFVAVFISLLIGVFMGALSGYFGGKVDAAIMWIINVT